MCVGVCVCVGGGGGVSTEPEHCFHTKHKSVFLFYLQRSASEDWLAQNQDNVSVWSDMSIRRLLFQRASTIKVQLRLLLKYKADTNEIPQKYSRLPQPGAIFLSAPPLTWNPGSAPGLDACLAEKQQIPIL
jgi:hypothetical protein